MARPIEATPTLYGEDAERLLRDLENVASPEVIAKRQQIVRDRLAEIRSRKRDRGTQTGG